MPKKPAVFTGNSLKANPSDREATEIITFTSSDPKIKQVQMINSKKKKAAAKQQSVPAEQELTDWVRKKRPWSKKPKREGQQKKQRGRSDEQGIDSADDEEAGPIAIKEHDHIDPIQEKPEREEDEQTNTVNIGDGNSQSKKSYDLKKTSSHNLRGLPPDAQFRLVDSEQEQLEIPYTGKPQAPRDPERKQSATKENLERGGEQQSLSQHQRLRTSELVRELAGSEEQGPLDEAAELQDIPVLRSGATEEDTEDFVQKLGVFIQNFEIEDPEQLQLLYEEVAKRNPNISEEDLAQIFENIVNQLQDIPDGFEEEDERIEMVA